MHLDWHFYKEKEFVCKKYTSNGCAQRRDHVRTMWPSGSQGKRPHKKPNTWTPSSWTSSLPNCEKINFCCLCHPVCGILLYSPSKLIYVGNCKIRQNYKEHHNETHKPIIQPQQWSPPEHLVSSIFPSVPPQLNY